MVSVAPVSTEVQAALSARPKLLYSREQKLVVLWSPLCASTAAVLWFVQQAGLFSDYQKFTQETGRFRHGYRNRIQRKQKYADHLPEVTEDSYSVICFVRNPFSRAVSSFLHCVSNAEKFPELFPGKSSGEPVLSFAKYVQFLCSANLQACDPHYQVQRHSAERQGVLTPTHIVRLETLAEDIWNIETRLNLPHIDAGKGGRTLYTESRIPYAEKPLSPACIEKGVPRFQHFYTPELEAAIRQLYKEDFAAYGYSESLPESVS